MGRTTAGTRWSNTAGRQLQWAAGRLVAACSLLQLWECGSCADRPRQPHARARWGNGLTGCPSNCATQINAARRPTAVFRSHGAVAAASAVRQFHRLSLGRQRAGAGTQPVRVTRHLACGAGTQHHHQHAAQCVRGAPCAPPLLCRRQLLARSSTGRGGAKPFGASSGAGASLCAKRRMGKEQQGARRPVLSHRGTRPGPAAKAFSRQRLCAGEEPGQRGAAARRAPEALPAVRGGRDRPLRSSAPTGGVLESTAHSETIL